MQALGVPALSEEIGDMTSHPGTGPSASAGLEDPYRQPRTEAVDPSGRPDFAAIVHGIDLTRPLCAEDVDAIHAAIDRYGVLIFRDQHLDDAQQVAFSRQLGPLELATGDIGEVKDRRLAMELNDISNLDKYGEVLPRDNRARLFGLGNRLWHSDSSFEDVPAKDSLLSARQIP
jgi:alpha-ketoglutarate-dependent 2,4-dichlorophenoxyacetate dioxygenase